MKESKKTLFIEKYRPETLDDVVGQKHVIKALKGFVKNDKIPHMLFAGPAGTGKTTSSVALAHDLYGKDWKKYFLEMNASDDNGIDTIRNKVKEYARVKVIGRDYKLIFLDECDAMSASAQAALRRIMELYSEKCRFILSCNYPNKIIDPIKDRCVAFRFRILTKDDMKQLLQTICDNEEIGIKEEALDFLSKSSKGSMRQPLNILFKLKWGDEVDEITKQDIEDSICYVDERTIKKLLVTVKDGDVSEVDDYIDSLLYQYSYTPVEILNSLREILKGSKVLSSDKVINALRAIGRTTFRISQGSPEDVELKTLAIELILLYE